MPTIKSCEVLPPHRWGFFCFCLLFNQQLSLSLPRLSSADVQLVSFSHPIPKLRSLHLSEHQLLRTGIEQRRVRCGTLSKQCLEQRYSPSDSAQSAGGQPWVACTNERTRQVNTVGQSDFRHRAAGVYNRKDMPPLLARRPQIKQQQQPPRCRALACCTCASYRR